eukprot:1795810-Amphidinium_carterae.1
MLPFTLSAKRNHMDIDYEAALCSLSGSTTIATRGSSVNRSNPVPGGPVKDCIFHSGRCNCLSLSCLQIVFTASKSFPGPQEGGILIVSEPIIRQECWGFGGGVNTTTLLEGVVVTQQQTRKV